MNIRRRALIKATGAAALAAFAHDRANAATAAGPDGLIPDPNGILDLPEGFSYRVIGRFGETMSDGYRSPGNPDAMACFDAPDGKLVLMRNHEVSQGDDGLSPYFPEQARPVQAYDPDGTGGVTRLVIDPESLEVKSSNLVLAGTYWNCAGGVSPWGWLSCEETVDDPRHGYVFLCPSDADRVRSPQRIISYGRMRHEAAAVDPSSLIAYMTEDRIDGCVYRFVPDKPEQPFHGTLQALAIRDQRGGYETALLRQGQRVPVAWVDLERPDSADDSLRFEAQQQGAARVARSEGLWLAAEGEAYFCATAGGALGRGQIFRLTLGPDPSLEVVAESTDPAELDMPDNLCVSPHGQLYVAEDGLEGNYVRKVSRDGRVLPFARNALSSSEFAGPCFSPDGSTLFVNIQHDHLTLAVRGPFTRPLPLEARAARATSSDAQRTQGRHDCSHDGMARGGRGLGVGLAVLAFAALTHRRRGLRSARKANAASGPQS